MLGRFDNNQIVLVLTDQVRDEFFRNRGAKIADAMKELHMPCYAPAFPAFAKDYPEYLDLRKLLSETGKKYSELVEKMAKAASNKLKADSLVSDVFQKAKLIKFTEALYVKALGISGRLCCAGAGRCGRNCRGLLEVVRKGAPRQCL